MDKTLTKRPRNPEWECGVCHEFVPIGEHYSRLIRYNPDGSVDRDFKICDGCADPIFKCAAEMVKPETVLPEN